MYVDPARVGTYNITYKYYDFYLDTVKTANRTVYVQTSGEDVIAFTIKINNGNPIVRGTKREDVPITIHEIYRNGFNDIETTVGDLASLGYAIENFDTEVVGDYTSTVSRTKANSDGTIPSAQKVDYKIIPDTYKVTFNAAGGSVSPDSIIATYNKEYGDLPTPTRTGYDFIGWYTESVNGTSVSSKTIMDKLYEHTLYAHWSPKTFVINFNANGGTVSTGSTTVTYDSTYGSLPTPYRDGYDFVGWYTQSSGGTLISSGSKVTILSNQILYAHWVSSSYNIYFDPNGGYLNQTSKTVTYGSPYGSLPVPSRSGYSFDGWYTGGGSYVYYSTIFNQKSDQTLYASWSYINYNYDYTTRRQIPITTRTTAKVTTTTKKTTTRTGITKKPTTTTTTTTRCIQCEMEANSEKWFGANKSERESLHQVNLSLASELAEERSQVIVYRSDGSYYYEDNEKVYSVTKPTTTTKRTTKKTTTKKTTTTTTRKKTTTTRRTTTRTTRRATTTRRTTTRKR